MATDTNDTRTDPLLQRFVAMTGAGCPTCGGSLAELPGDRCPGCNEQLVLDVAMAESGSRQIVAGTIGLALGFGFCASLSAVIYVNTVRLGITPAWNRIMPVFIGAPVLGLALLAWVMLRRRVRVLSLGSRRMYAVMCWVLSCAFVVWLTANILLGVL